MVKGLGIAFIALSGVLWGIFLIKRAQLRVNSLKMLECLANTLSAALKYSYISIDEFIISESKKESAPDFLKICAGYIKNDGDFHSGWDRATEICFDKKDVSFVKRFGEKLGVSDLEGQITHINYYLKETEERLSNAREQKQKAEKAGIPLFGCLGIGTAILLV